MSLIEGFGDEVPLVFCLSAVLVGFLFLAWKSTEVSEPSVTEQAVPFTFTISSNVSIINNGFQVPSVPSAPTVVPESISPDSNLPLPTSDGDIVNESRSSLSTPSADVDEHVSDLLTRNKDDGTSSSLGETFTIKLMFMDDTHKIVEARSQQTLKDFKMKNFQVELTANKVVKLIFNGQVLSDEASRLSQLGFNNNCVVHCLVHQRRPSVVASDTVQRPRNSLQDGDVLLRNIAAAAATTQETGIDIGGLLVPLFGIILALVWYCQIAYATYFSTAATAALVGLSSLCIFSFFVFSYPIVQDGLF